MLTKIADQTMMLLLINRVKLTCAFFRSLSFIRYWRMIFPGMMSNMQDVMYLIGYKYNQK